MNHAESTGFEGSGRPAKDYSYFCEGDTVPSLNKKIKVLILGTEDYIVFVDEDGYVEWAFTDEFGEWPAGFDDVANRIGHLESLSVTQLKEKQREPFARLLGEGMARVLGGNDVASAKMALGMAEAYLAARGTENAREWYLEGAGIISFLALIIGGMLLLVRGHVQGGHWRDIVEIGVGAAVGSLGAFLSIASRTESIRLEPVAGYQIHTFEGAVRVIVGITGAFFVALAMKGDFLLGAFSSLTHPFLSLVVACLIAGASERLAPGLIKSMGNSMEANSSGS